MIEIKAVSDVQLAFPANVDDYLPPWDTIPEEFKGHGNKWNSLFLSRLRRKSWVTTKKASRLYWHLYLYIAYRNNYMKKMFS